MAGNVPVVQPEAALAASDNHADALAWVRALRSAGAERERTAAKLHRLLLRAARFELSRQRAQLHAARGETFEKISRSRARTTP